MARQPGFYLAMSAQTPFICPGCDSPPCRCDALLYRLDL
jgi:hypothetical protein